MGERSRFTRGAEERMVALRRDGWTVRQVRAERFERVHGGLAVPSNDDVRRAELNVLGEFVLLKYGNARRLVEDRVWDHDGEVELGDVVRAAELFLNGSRRERLVVSAVVYTWLLMGRDPESLEEMFDVSRSEVVWLNESFRGVWDFTELSQAILAAVRKGFDGESCRAGADSGGACAGTWAGRGAVTGS